MLAFAEPEPDVQDAPGSVALHHRLFTLLPETVFQLASDGVAVMAMPIGERRALIPVRSLAMELGIAQGSADGRMLALLPQALTYVNWLGLNDPLPPEMVSGQASWSPGPEHLTIAVRRMQNRLLRWHSRRGGTPAGLVRAAEAGEDTDEVRRVTQQAFEQAAQVLRMTSAGAVIAEAEALARELAYIECLRESLLQPVHALSDQLASLGGGGRLDMNRAEMRAAVSRLMSRAKHMLSERFAEADEGLDDDIVGTIRDADLKTASLRRTRDGLHRSKRAWQVMFDAWQDDSDEQTQWKRMEDTYRFLAPRYMSVTEWGKRPDPAAADRECVVW